MPHRSHLALALSSFLALIVTTPASADSGAEGGARLG